MGQPYLHWQHVYPMIEGSLHDFESFDCRCSPKIHWDSGVIEHKPLLEKVKEAFHEREDLY